MKLKPRPNPLAVALMSALALSTTHAGGIATIMADEFFNVYDKTGPGMSDYKP